MPQSGRESHRHEPQTLRPYADLCARGLEHAMLDLAAHRATATAPLFDDLRHAIDPPHATHRRRAS